MKSTDYIAYIAIISKTDGEKYRVEFPDLPDCTAQGATLEEAIYNAQEALGIHHVEVAGKFPPAAKDIASIQKQHPHSLVQFVAINVNKPLPKSMRFIKKTLTLPDQPISGTQFDRIRSLPLEEFVEWVIREAPEIGRNWTDSKYGLIEYLKQPIDILAVLTNNLPPRYMDCNDLPSSIRKVDEMTKHIDFNHYLDSCLAEDPDLAAEYRALKPMYDVASIVIKLRVDRGLTHAEFAAQCGLTTEDIILLETGNIQSVQLDTLQRIATQMGYQLHIDVVKDKDS